MCNGQEKIVQSKLTLGFNILFLLETYFFFHNNQEDENNEHITVIQKFHKAAGKYNL